MARTISQIAGEFGLTRGASNDPFSQQETAVLSNVQKSLEEMRSQQLEAQSARGFGRSSFSDAITAKQTADVVGQVGQQFAQARTQEQLAENAFQRGIISSEIGTDQQSRLGAEQGFQQRLTLADQISGQYGLAEVQGSQQRLTLADQLAGESNILGLKSIEERKTLAEQIAGQSKLSTQQANQGLTQLEKQGAIETDLQKIKGLQSIEGIKTQTAGQAELQTQAANESRLTLVDQAKFAMEQLNVANQAREQLAVTSGEQSRISQAQAAVEQNSFLKNQAQFRIDEINSQHKKALEMEAVKYNNMERLLPQELKWKADQELRVKEKELEIIREQKIIDTAIQTATSYILSNLSGKGLSESLLNDIKKIKL